MRDVDPGNRIIADSVINVSFDEREAVSLEERYRLRRNDILFKNRGSNNTATLYDLEWGNAIASHQFLIIRITSPAVLPGYLKWCINSKSAQSHFKQHATGATTLLIQKKALEELEVLIPDIETQKKIVTINLLHERERELMNRRIELREKKIETIMSECIKSIRKI